MEFDIKYSYEFNSILNPELNETEQIKNFASLITDRDRFFLLLKDVEENLEKLETYLGYKLSEKLIIYIVRAEKFDSFSEPITIEYKVETELMIINLLKEIVKTTIPVRFPDEEYRNFLINIFIEYFFKSINKENYNKYIQKILNKDNISEEDLRKFNFSKKTFLEVVKNFYIENPNFLEELHRKQNQLIQNGLNR